MSGFTGQNKGDYRPAVVITKIKRVDDQNIVDLPFQIFHLTLIENQNNHYCYVPQDKSYEGAEVLCYIHYQAEDEELVTKSKEFISNDWAVAAKDARVLKHWALTKEIAFATATVNPVDINNPIITKYDGLDKLDIVHPYKANDVYSSKTIAKLFRKNTF